MRILDTAIADVKLVLPVQHGDARGFFSETYRRDAFARAGLDVEFVQDNCSRSRAVGTLRGLHYQREPRAQGKLVRVGRGAVLDVAVDLRVGSPSFGRHVAVRLSADEWNQLWVPAGFAHGFCTLEPDSEVLYKVTDYHSPDHDAGLAWDDPALGIEWPFEPGALVTSERDRRHPRLAELPVEFRHPGAR